MNTKGAKGHEKREVGRIGNPAYRMCIRAVGWSSCKLNGWGEYRKPKILYGYFTLFHGCWLIK
jgi:hypothetical protein